MGCGSSTKKKYEGDGGDPPPAASSQPASSGETPAKEAEKLAPDPAPDPAPPSEDPAGTQQAAETPAEAPAENPADPPAEAAAAAAAADAAAAAAAASAAADAAEDAAAAAAAAAADPDHAGRAAAIRGHRKGKDEKVRRNPGASRTEPRRMDWSCADAEKWSFPSVSYNGGCSYHKQPEYEECTGPIQAGIDKLKSDPLKYLGLYHQTNMVEWSEDQQKYKFVLRTKSGFSVKEDPAGAFTYICAHYQALEANVEIPGDGVTDTLTYAGSALAAAVCPGRGQGFADVPMVKVMGDVDPSDVAQGSVGDCWLLSAISGLAEFDGAIKKLFANTPDIDTLPADVPNTYTVTLYDLATFEPKDVVVDERLCMKADGTGLLGATPTVTGELWVCYVEKAIAIHCGGWDKINGGNAAHAWSLLTGNKNQYTFMEKAEGFGCFGKYNPYKSLWETQANSPKEGFRGLWPMKWPDAGGGGDMKLRVDNAEMFDRMCAWDDAGYMMGCGTKAGSDTKDTDGIVDGHAYTILDVMDNAGGTEFDMIKVRNPWGKGEFKSGRWDDDGAGWTEFPAVKEACNPVVADDGVFWLDKDEFFTYFKTIYLSAFDMQEFCG